MPASDSDCSATAGFYKTKHGQRPVSLPNLNARKVPELTFSEEEARLLEVLLTNQQSAMAQLPTTGKTLALDDFPLYR